MNRQKGFAVVELLLILAIIGLIGFVVWRVVLSSEPDAVIDQSTVQSQTVPTVDTASDIDKLDNQLDQTDIEGNFDQELQDESGF